MPGDGRDLNPVSIARAVVTWPVHRFADQARVYDLSIPPSDAAPLIRGSIAIDPLFRDFRSANAQSVRMEVVGKVTPQNRFEIYRSGKYSSGIGLVGRIEATPTGSRMVARVGWCGPTKWFMPGFTLLALVGSVGFAFEIPGAISGGADDLWPTAALAAMVVGGQLLNLTTTYQRARDSDLPVLFEHVERLLAAYRQ